MKILLLVMLSLSVSSQAVALKPELEHLSKTLTSLSGHFGAPPPPARDDTPQVTAAAAESLKLSQMVVDRLNVFKDKATVNQQDIDKARHDLAALRTSGNAPAIIAEFTKLIDDRSVALALPPPPAPYVGPKPQLPSELPPPPLAGTLVEPQKPKGRRPLPPPPPPSGLGTTKLSESEQELLEHLERDSAPEEFSIDGLTDNLTEAKNLKTISSDKIKPYEIRLFEITKKEIGSIVNKKTLDEQDKRELDLRLKTLSNYNAYPDVAATFKPQIVNILMQHLESLLRENFPDFNSDEYIDFMNAIREFVGQENMVLASNKLFEKIKPELTKNLAKSEWESEDFAAYSIWLEILKKAGVSAEKFRNYQEQISLKAQIGLSQISKKTVWNNDDIHRYYYYFKQLKDFGLLPKESSAYQEQLISLLMSELEKEFSQVKTWKYETDKPINNLVGMLRDVGASNTQLKKYQDILWSNVKIKLDEIFNEKDIQKLTEPTNPARSYLLALERRGAPQEDVIKYKDLYVKYTKNKIDVMLNEHKEKRIPYNLRVGNSLLESLRDQNVSEDEIQSYLKKINEIIEKSW